MLEKKILNRWSTRSVTGILMLIIFISAVALTGGYEGPYHDLLYACAWIFYLCALPFWNTSRKDKVRQEVDRDFKVWGQNGVFALAAFVYGIWIAGEWDKGSVVMIHKLMPYLFAALVLYIVYYIIAYQRELGRRRRLAYDATQGSAN